MRIITICLVIVTLLTSLFTTFQNSVLKLDAQPISNDSKSSNTFDKIIEEPLHTARPDKFLESKGFFAPNAPRGADTGTFDLMARFGPVIVYSNNIKNNSRTIDFDHVPATTPPDFMRFMPPYQALFYVFNSVTQNITINSIRISGVVSKETQSPFDFCGMNYNNTSIYLLPGYTQTFSICYFPKLTGNSSAKLEFYQGSQIIFDIPLRGNGVIPVNMSEERGMNNTISKQSNDNNDNNTSITKEATDSNLGRIPFAISNLTSDSQSFVMEPLRDCSVKIEGGGQRPDPAANGNGSNTAPLDPPDDGVDVNDTSTYHHRINVGELVKLEAKVNGIPLGSIQNIRWTIAEPKIKNYDESIPGKFVTYKLKDQDYFKPAISFYWKDGGDKEVTVSVEGIINNQSKKCDATRTFTVERNHDDINRQAEDFYVFNHNATVLDNHLNWHERNPIVMPCDPSNNGEKFFLFHKRVISNFDAWRETFGYLKIIAWDPANNPPNSTDLYDENRDPNYRPQPIYSYYTTEGGNTSSYCSPVYKQDIRKLGDYKSADYLASEVEQTWHGEVHVAVGGEFGDMNDLGLAPKDPVFWMWHKNIDSVYDKYSEIKDHE